MLEKVFLWWQSRKTKRKMNRVFSRGQDPYHYGSNPYETARLEAMKKALGTRVYRHALEIGCAEGAFTKVLAEHVEGLTALDISEVALERARLLLKGRKKTAFIVTDIRVWSPSEGLRYDIIVLGDVLYYLDKPMVREEFEKTFKRIGGWLEEGGRIVLAHGFAGDKEKTHRRGFRERFEKLGFKMVSEEVVPDPDGGPVSCLLSVLQDPG